MDIDQYDSDDAVYFVCFDNDDIVGSARLNQTSKSSLLADLFPFLIETDEDPRGPTIFEGSRFIVCPRNGSTLSSRHIKSAVLSSLVEFCLEQGGTLFQAVIDFPMLPTFTAMTLKTRPLGLPQEYGGGIRAYGGGRCLAFRWELTTELLSDLLQFGLSAVDAAPSGSPGISLQ